ncbi:MAG: hypothetical protein Q7R34_03915, partial [Dehalococcoidia bacterium]|nr:hypothetical protein [Dehalococcoidia bacterium]
MSSSVILSELVSDSDVLLGEERSDEESPVPLHSRTFSYGERFFTSFRMTLRASMIEAMFVIWRLSI